jgi:hypothetical protein
VAKRIVRRDPGEAVRAARVFGQTRARTRATESNRAPPDNRPLAIGTTRTAPLADEIVPRAIRNAWKIERGRPFAFGGRRGPSGEPPGRSFSPHGAPISWLMADLHRRAVPPIVKLGDVKALVEEIGLSKNGALAERIEGYARHSSMSALLFPSNPTPGPMITRYVLADVLAGGADARGRVDLAAMRSRRGYLPSDVDKLVRWIGSRPVGPRIKQYEDAPYDLDVLDPGGGWLSRAPGTSPYAIFAALFRAIRGQQAARHEERMTLLDEILEDYLRPTYGPAREHDVVWAREHVLGSNGTRYAAARYGRAGKAYSTSIEELIHESARLDIPGFSLNLAVVEELDGHALLDHHALGIRGDLVPWYKVQRSLIEHGIELDRDYERFVAVDSGASALLLLNEMLERGRAGNSSVPLHDVSGVEHTRDGARKLKKLGDRLLMAVVDAAESPVKLNMVALVVAWSIVEEIERTIADLRDQGVELGRKVLLTGYGSNGSRIAPLLRDIGYEVIVKETDSDILAMAPEERPPKEEWPSEQAKRAGFEVIEEVPEGIDTKIVVGCVGLPSLTAEEIRRLPNGAALFSASSSNKEFPFRDDGGWKLDDWQWRGHGGPPSWFHDGRHEPAVRFQGKQILRGAAGFDLAHWHRVIRSQTNPKHELLLVNSLFPVDLTGHSDPISPVLVQLTRALMLLAVSQARSLPAETRGLVQLDPEGQRVIADRWMAIVREMDPPIPKKIMSLLEAEHRRTLAELAEQTSRSRRHIAN